MPTHILVIDDEPKWIGFIRDDLETYFEVEVVTSLKAALTKLKKNNYKLIVASSNCLDIIKIINKKYPEEPIIVVTGQPTLHEAIDVYRLGVLDYFTKDFRSRTVSEKIYKALQKSVPALA